MNDRSADEADHGEGGGARWNPEASYPGVNDEAGITYGVINWFVKLWRKLGGER